MQKLQVVDRLTSSPLHSIPLCEGCFFVKQQLMFPKEGNCATTILALVHFDVSRPMQTHSHGGAQYFLTFIDDCNRFLVVALLKSKTKVFQHFKNYKVMSGKTSQSISKKFMK
jgi:hypothetical protein